MMIQFIIFTDSIAAMTTSTLLIGYYHGLLLKRINADLLTDKMCTVGLLTSQDQTIIASGHSIYHKNQLLLGYVRHMDVQASLTFCELVQEIWPQIGSQLIAGVSTFVCKVHVNNSQAVQWSIVQILLEKLNSFVPFKVFYGNELIHWTFPCLNAFAQLSLYHSFVVYTVNHIIER